MFGPERYENLVNALALSGNQRVVDLGCGRGQTLAALAFRLGPDAQLVGVDRSVPRFESTLADDPRVCAIVADLNRPLPFAESSFDAAACHNTLECLTEKTAFLSEVGRILRPGALFLLGHADFDTLVFNTSDVELTRRMVHGYADTTERWMDASDGTMGRKLLGAAWNSGMTILQTYAWVGLCTSLAPGTPAREAVHAVAAAARKHADLAPHVEDWLRDLEALDRRGEFLYSINDYAVLLRKPI
jgi:SAM-dependent methyltransferase